MDKLKRLSAAAALAATAFLLLGAARPQGDEEKKPTFDPAANAKVALTEAIAFAKKKHKRVLVIWGHDAGAGHVEFVEALRKGRKPWPFYYEYQLVPVDTGADGKHNAELSQALGVAPLTANPRLTLLDADGKPLANREAGEYRGEEGWSEEKLGKLLAEFAVEPEDAEKVLKAMQARAAKENKRLLVHLGAPW